MTEDKKHWVFDYLGKPWQRDGQGPDAFNCWALVRTVQRDRFGRILPIIDIDGLDTKAVIDNFKTNDEFANWRLVDSPLEGDCVITKSAPDKPEHVGLWVDSDGGRILQCVVGSGVVLVSPRATRRIIGQHLEFWRYAG